MELFTCRAHQCGVVWCGDGTSQLQSPSVWCGVVMELVACRANQCGVVPSNMATQAHSFTCMNCSISKCRSGMAATFVHVLP